VKRVAVVGSGIAGLSTAYALAGQAQVTLYEASDYFGGHAHTVDVTLGGVTHGVDTGFLVFNCASTGWRPPWPSVAPKPSWPNP